jgi:Transposase DDE domain
MISVTRMEELFTNLLETKADELARSTGFVQRARKLSGADFVQILTFGHLRAPTSSLDQLTQVAQLRDVQISSEGAHQRLTEPAARFLQAVLEEVVGQVLAAEPVEIAEFPRFSQVIIEDSSTVALPAELKELWPGCGAGNNENAEAALKLHVRWDLRSGALWGPKLTAGRVSDQNSPWNEDPLPRGSLYVADLGYLNLERFRTFGQGKIYFASRIKSHMVMADRQGKRINLLTALPQRVGQCKVLRVQVGWRKHMHLRLLAVRVPDEVVEQRRKVLQEQASKRGRSVSEKQWELAKWTLLLTNAPAKVIGVAEGLVFMRARWAIEMLFKLWKSEGQIDVWRSQHPWRVLCELYSKLLAMVIQHWLLILGCWQDPYRSLVKAAQVVRSLALDWVEVLMAQRRFPDVERKMRRLMQSGCRVNHRATDPCLAQLLLEGLEWTLT